MASLESLAMSILPVSRGPDTLSVSDTERRHVGQRSLRTSLPGRVSADGAADENAHEDVRGYRPPPSAAVDALQKWNYPEANKGRFFATLFAFVLFGLNDSAYGVWVP